MVTEANTTTPATDAAVATPATPAVAKAKTVIDNMDSRRMFDSIAEAEAYLNMAAETYVDFAQHPQVIRGMIEETDADGNVTGASFDPAIYTDDMRVMVAVLANRGEKGQPSTVKAIVVTPAPKLDAILADEAARLWLTSKVLDKELNHVAVRVLRTAADVESVADQMPLTIADYISSSRESSGGIMETFNTLFKGLVASVAVKSPQWAKARLIKTDLKKAFESKAFAMAFFPLLEDRGEKPSLFVMALQLGQREAKAQGLAPDIFDRWLATRDQKPLKTTTAEGADDDDFDLDDLAFESDEGTAANTEATTGADSTGDTTDSGEAAATA